MDGPRLDKWARTAARASWATASRRATLRLLAGGAFGALAGLLGLEEASAACRVAGKPCRRDSQCCGRCVRRRCRATRLGTCQPGQGQDTCLFPGVDFVPCNDSPLCRCQVSIAGDTFCGPSGGICKRCAKDRDCPRDRFGHRPVCKPGCGSCSPESETLCTPQCLRA